MMKTKNKVRYYRKLKGLSQEKLAQLSGVSQSTISDLENGKHSTTFQNIKKVALVLDVSIDKLEIEG